MHTICLKKKIKKKEDNFQINIIKVVFSQNFSKKQYICKKNYSQGIFEKASLFFFFIFYCVIKD